MVKDAGTNMKSSIRTVGECERDRLGDLAIKYMKERDKLQTENTRLRTALEDIANPLQRIKREVPEGAKLNGQMAVALMESPDFYKDIARQALNAETNADER